MALSVRYQSFSTSGDCSSSMGIPLVCVQETPRNLPSQVIVNTRTKQAKPGVRKTDDFGTATTRMAGPEVATAVCLRVRTHASRVDPTAYRASTGHARG